jgi:chemotaxis methyl-accepting protein methylase
LKFSFQPSSLNPLESGIATDDMLRLQGGTRWLSKADLGEPERVLKLFVRNDRRVRLGDRQSLHVIGLGLPAIPIDLTALRAAAGAGDDSAISVAPISSAYCNAAALEAYLDVVLALEPDPGEQQDLRRRCLADADVVMLTLLHSEALHDADGRPVWFASGASEAEVRGWSYRLLSVDQNVACLRRSLEKIWRMNPAAGIVLTVAAAPLSATFGQEPPLIENGRSKANILAAVHAVLAFRRSLPECKLDYFPAYELQTGMLPGFHAAGEFRRELRDGLFAAFRAQFLDAPDASGESAQLMARLITRSFAPAAASSAGAVASLFTATSTAMFRNVFVTDLILADVRQLVATRGWCTIHVTACSRGYEAYTLAVALEAAGLWDRVALIASDHSDAALRQARDGWVAAADAARIPADHADRFAPGDKGSRLAPHLLDRIRFHHLDLVNGSGDGPFHRADIVVCNNVVQHMGAERQLARVDTLDKLLGGAGSTLCLYGYRSVSTAERLMQLGLLPDVTTLAGSLYADPFNPSPAPLVSKRGVGNPALDQVVAEANWPWRHAVRLTRGDGAGPTRIVGEEAFWRSTLWWNPQVFAFLRQLLQDGASAGLVVIGRAPSPESFHWLASLATGEDRLPNRPSHLWTLWATMPSPGKGLVVDERIVAGLPTGMRRILFNDRPKTGPRTMRGSWRKFFGGAVGIESALKEPLGAVGAVVVTSDVGPADQDGLEKGLRAISDHLIPEGRVFLPTWCGLDLRRLALTGSLVPDEAASQTCADGFVFLESWLGQTSVAGSEIRTDDHKLCLFRPAGHAHKDVG